MTREETAVIIKVLRTAYPGFYSRFKAADYADVVNLWATCFAGDDPQIVTYAVQNLIQTHQGYPPEIADVRAKVTEIVQAATGGKTDEDYWLMLKEALSDGVWGAKEQFDKLPAPLKRYCGSASWIRDHARMDADVVDSVIHGQFLKQFPKVKEAQEYRDSLPEPLKQAIAKIFTRVDDYKPLDAETVNNRRNLVIDLLGQGA